MKMKYTMTSWQSWWKESQSLQQEIPYWQVIDVGIFWTTYNKLKLKTLYSNKKYTWYNTKLLSRTFFCKKNWIFSGKDIFNKNEVRFYDWKTEFTFEKKTMEKATDFYSVSAREQEKMLLKPFQFKKISWNKEYNESNDFKVLYNTEKKCHECQLNIKNEVKCDGCIEPKILIDTKTDANFGKQFQPSFYKRLSCQEKNRHFSCLWCLWVVVWNSKNWIKYMNTHQQTNS